MIFFIATLGVALEEADAAKPFARGFDCATIFAMRPAVAFLVIVAVSLLDAQPPAPGHLVVRITEEDAIRPGEASIAINPANTDHIVAVSLQAMKPGSAARISNFSYTSIDGGRTWRTVAVPNEHRRVHGDDAVTIARDGTIYHSYIAFDGIRVPRPDRASSGIFVRTSRDGITWNEPVAVVDHINTAIPFEDKPWIGVDDGEDSPHRGNVYVAWTRFDVYGSDDPQHKSHIWFARARDGARSFTPPVQVSDTPGDAKDSDGTVEGVVPSVGPNGEVYVAWAGPLGLVFDKSLDGGYTFGKDKVIAAIPGGWDIPLPGIERHNGMPVTAVDHSRGPNRGSVYINWIDERNGDTDVFIVSSRDGGITWSSPVRVNDDPKGNNRAQLFTWMAVDPTDGSVNVVFLDRRDTQGTQNAVTLARSVDGGKTFVNHRVNRPPFPAAGNIFYGDYLGVDAHGGRVAAVFPVVVDAPNQLVLEAAIFNFKPGSQEPAHVDATGDPSARIELGRRLFYDARLSVNGQQACGACHRQEFAFTDARPRAVGATGQMHPRGTMSLINVAHRDTLTWTDETLTSLEAQALVPLLGENPVELGLKGHEERIYAELAQDPIYQRLFSDAFPQRTPRISTETVVAAIAAFERSIVSFRAPYDRFREGRENAISPAAQRGAALFFGTSGKVTCAQCHSGVNLDGGRRGAPAHGRTAEDIGRFRTPTLRNIAVTSPYMHDGSVPALADVLRPFDLASEERADLLAFLESLTDVDALVDSRWSDPWRTKW